MRLKVFLPDKMLMDQNVNKIIAEAENGSFCLLPRHIDFVAGLVPSILSFVRSDSNTEEYLAVDEGTLVKCGDEVRVSTRKAVLSPNLDQLKNIMEQQFLSLDEEDRKTRSLIAKFEIDFVRNILKLK